MFLGDPSIPEIRLRHEGYKYALAHAPPGTARERIVPAHLTAEAAYEAMRALSAAAKSSMRYSVLPTSSR